MKDSGRYLALDERQIAGSPGEAVIRNGMSGRIHEAIAVLQNVFLKSKEIDMKLIPRLKACACVAMIAAMAVPVAAQQCKPVTGSFEAAVQPANTCPGVLCTAGRVWGGIQGDYRFTMDRIIANGEPEVPTISFFTGHSIITLKNGDQLFGTDTGTIDLPPGQGGFASLITFTGGTGGMANATGQIRLRGEFDPVAGTTSGEYTGKLCTP